VLGSVDMKSISKKLNFKFEQMGNPTLLQWLNQRIHRYVKTGLQYTYKDKYIFKVITNPKKGETKITIQQK
jgi:hypothetical protein